MSARRIAELLMVGALCSACSFDDYQLASGSEKNASTMGDAMVEGGARSDGPEAGPEPNENDGPVAGSGALDDSDGTTNSDSGSTTDDDAGPTDDDPLDPDDPDDTEPEPEPGEDCLAGSWDDDGNRATPCVTCTAGHYCEGGSAAPIGCAAGAWDHDGDAATQCTGWSDCQPGTHVAKTPSSTMDRACEPCETGTFSSQLNQSECLPDGACPAGTVQTAAATTSTPAQCEACDPGNHCPGGAAPAAPCTTGNWDHDASPATACVAWTTCGLGMRVANTPSATADRDCQACESGTFSDQSNQSECTQHSTCAAGTYVTRAPSSAFDRSCASCTSGYTTGTNAASCSEWSTCDEGSYVSTTPTATRDRGCSVCTNGYTTGSNAASCTAWSICQAGSYVSTTPTATRDRGCMGCTSGYTTGTNATSCTAWSVCQAGSYVSTTPTATRDRGCMGCTNGYTNSTNASACNPWTVCSAGTAQVVAPTNMTDRSCSYYLWSTTYGASGNDFATGLAVSGGHLYVSGSTQGTLSGQSSSGGTDAMLLKFTTAGAHVWSTQFGTNEADSASGVAADGQGGIYVVGTLGQYNSQTNDNRNGFLRKYADSNAALQWSKSFGLYGMNATLVWNGVIYAAGLTTTQPFVKRFNTAGTEQSGLSVTTGGYGPERMAVDPTGSLFYLGGHTYEALDAQTNHGWTDVYIRKHDSSLQRVTNGTVLFGTASTDYVADMAVDGQGNIYLSGRMSAGAVNLGPTNIANVAQGYSAFVSAFNSSLSHQWTRVVFLGPNDSFNALAGAPGGGVYVAARDTLRKYDTAGNLVFGHDLGGATARDLALTATGELYLVGERSGDLFLARMAP